MAVPAPLLEALSSFSEGVPTSGPANLESLPVPARWLAGARELRAALPELKKRAQHLEVVLGELRDKATGLGARLSNRDELIDFLESAETRIEETLKAEIVRAKANRRHFFSAPGLTKDERSQIIGVPEHYEKILVGALEALRDTRWWLMAQRAEFGDQGDAPVFDDPEMLFKYLDEQTR
jgi:hypothetical protein